MDGTKGVPENDKGAGGRGNPAVDSSIMSSTVPSRAEEGAGGRCFSFLTVEREEDEDEGEDDDDREESAFILCSVALAQLAAAAEGGGGGPEGTREEAEGVAGAGRTEAGATLAWVRRRDEVEETDDDVTEEE